MLKTEAVVAQHAYYLATSYSLGMCVSKLNLNGEKKTAYHYRHKTLPAHSLVYEAYYIGNNLTIHLRVNTRINYTCPMHLLYTLSHAYLTSNWLSLQCHEVCS